MISNEHPEALERLMPEESLEPKVRSGMRLLKASRVMQVTSEGGTDLTIKLEGARVGGVWGYTSKPGTIAHWPGGLCLAFPSAGSVEGKLVLTPGDVNLTFKRYLRDVIALTVDNDYVSSIDGEGVDADMMRGYFEAWGDRQAYGVSHVGWDESSALGCVAFYDSRISTAPSAHSRQFLVFTGATRLRGGTRWSHFDLPLRIVVTERKTVVDRGKLLGELA
jgi:2,5-dihydroxypyridine 5,6-dioxygenase